MIVFDSPAVSVADVHCETTAREAREIQGENRYEVLFVRSGCFTFRDSRGEVLADPTTCVLGSPRQLADVGHPAAGGDVYTQIAVSADVWHDLTCDTRVPLAARVSGPMQVAIQALTASVRRHEDRMAMEEAAVNLVAAAIAHSEPGRPYRGPAKSDRDRRQLAENARTILVSDPTISSVRQVAACLGCSPGHLSRVFRAHTGSTVAGYRTQLRVSLAIQLIAEANASLAETAALCGFADQAHLNRALRIHTGSTPGKVRDMITSRILQG